MIKKYLFNISRLLPPSNREEVIKEIESGLYDFLEEHYGKVDYTDAQLESAILAMGHPKQVADAYRGRSSALISGRYFDLYLLVLKIALIASLVGTGFAIAIGEAVSASSGDSVLVSFFIDLFSAFWEIGLNVFAIVTLIFAVVEYYSPIDDEVPVDQAWDIKAFQQMPNYSEAVSRVDMIFEIFFTSVGIAVVNTLLPNVLADQTSSVIILMVSVVMGVQILLDCYLLFKGSWQKATRLLTLLLNGISLVLSYVIFMSPLGIDHQLVSIKLGERIASGVQISLSITFAIIALILIWDSIGQIKHMFTEGK